MNTEPESNPWGYDQSQDQGL